MLEKKVAVILAVSLLWGVALAGPAYFWQREAPLPFHLNWVVEMTLIFLGIWVFLTEWPFEDE